MAAFQRDGEQFIDACSGIHEQKDDVRCIALRGGELFQIFRRKCNDGLLLFRRQNDKLRVVHLENLLPDPPFGNLAGKLLHLVAGAPTFPAHCIYHALPVLGADITQL